MSHIQDSKVDFIIEFRSGLRPFDTFEYPTWHHVENRTENDQIKFLIGFEMLFLGDRNSLCLKEYQNPLYQTNILQLFSIVITYTHYR